MNNVNSGTIQPIVCIDAGHYGKRNRSPVVAEYYESEMNWKLQNYQKYELEKYGVQVITTRKDEQKDMALITRGKASRGCDLFISNHSNACDTPTVDRPVVIVQLDGRGDALGAKLAACIRETMQTNDPSRVATRKGIHGEYYGVLRGAAKVGTVGMILEHSFHTNPRMARWLLVDDNLKKLAKLSVVLGILVNIIILAEQIMTVFVYDLPGLLLSEKIIHVGGMFQVDLTFLIYWAILMLLSYVFRYGEGLQQLSDETL